LLLRNVGLLIALILSLMSCAPSPRYTVGGASGNTPSKPSSTPFISKKTIIKKTAEDPTPTSVKEGMVFEGLASYYADDFDGKLTANGETYNMHGLTCAHKTLPFNTWIEVSNLSNGRKVIVRVNDRGPYIGDRIIDLSLGAAKEVDMISAGIQKVSIEVLSTP